MVLKRSIQGFIPPPLTYIRPGVFKERKDVRRIGDEQKANIVFNCITCSRWPVCHDPKKSVMYKCSRYKEAVIDGSSIEEILKNPEDLDYSSTEVEEEDFYIKGDDEETIEDMIAKVINSNVPVPPDLRIDDREIPLAKNFYDWVTNKELGGQSQNPFPRQLEYGARLFGDVCSHCSDLDWFDNVKVNTPLGHFPERLVFFENGKCPKCGSRRGEQILNHEIENYYGVIGLAGQRCITGDSLVTTTHGFKYMKELIHPSYQEGFNKFKYSEAPRKGRYECFEVALENGYTEKPSDFFISAKEKTITVKTELGYSIEGSFDHPVMTQRGWVKLKDLNEEDLLKIQVGQNVWSSVDYVDVDTAKLMGYIVSEGHYVGSRNGDKLYSIKITNKDPKVLSFCLEQARKLGYESEIKHYEERVSEVLIKNLKAVDKKTLSLHFGDEIYRSATQRIPDSILKSSKSVMSSFLRGLFEGDGGINSSLLEYTTISKKLAKEIQIVLANFGIFTYLREFTAYATNSETHCGTKAYSVSINGRDSLRVFEKEIGFESERKRRGLSKLINVAKEVPYKTDTLLQSLQDSIISLLTNIQNSVSVFKTRGSKTRCTLRSLGIRLDRLSRQEYQLSRLNALKIINSLQKWEHFSLIPSEFKGELAKYKDELSSNYYYSKIASLKISKKKKVTYDFTVPNAHRFMANGIINHNSGKTSTAILWDSYNLHRMLKLPSPQGVFSTLDTQVFTYTYTALTFNQAVSNVWNPYMNTIRNLPWFKNYHSFLRRKGNQLGEELFHLGEHMIRYRHRNLILNPAGPSKRNMRGASRVTGLVDEAGYFLLSLKSGKGDPERLDALGVFTALNNSLFTLKSSHRRKIEEGYDDLPKPMMYAISSPSAYNDFIMTSYRLYRNSTEFFAYKAKTWNFNPLIKKSDLAEDFRTKPVEAARDYECNPPIGESLFINQTKSLEPAFTYGPNKIVTSTSKAKSKSGVNMTSAEVHIKTNKFPTYGTVLCIDLGLVNNSLSFSIVGLPDEYEEDLLPEDRGTVLTPVQVFAVGEVIPLNDTKISLTDVYTKCFIPLIESFNVMYCYSDRWNSEKILQDMEASHDVVPVPHKCNWEDFENTRDLLYSGNLMLPKTQNTLQENMETVLDNYPEVFRGKPVDHLQWQFMTVKEHTNVTVIKGDGGTDDAFRTIVLGVHALQDLEVVEELLKGKTAQVVIKPFLGMTGKLSGGGGNAAASTASSGGFLCATGKKRG